MKDTTVTVVGNVVDSPRRAIVGSSAVTNFRMASTARRFDPGRQQFVDGATLWIDVECWDALSGNVSASVSKGDPVIVHGALTTHEWESDNGPRSKPRIKASAVGPNLAKGRSLFTRDQPRRTGEAAGDTAGSSSTRGEESGPDDEGQGPAEELLPGRDYEVEGAALDRPDADLPWEPAHA